jgi:hypothetical protein
MLLIQATSVSAQTQAVPVALAIEPTTSQIKAGESVKLTITLKNVYNGAVVALEPTTVIIKTTPGSEVRLVIPTGASSARAELQFPSPGISVIQVSSPRLAAAFAHVVAVGPPPRADAPGAKSGEESGVASATESSNEYSVAQARPAGADQIKSIVLLVSPNPIPPKRGTWQSGVYVTALGRNNLPRHVHHDTLVRGSAQIGNLDPNPIVIPAGSAVNQEGGHLVSNQAGRDVITVWPKDGGDAVQQNVEYEREIPTKLLVEVTPKQALSSGQTRVTVTVILQDEMNDQTSADRDIAIVLTASQGDLHPHRLVIPRGESWGEATLTSAVEGPVSVTARAEGLAGNQSEVVFSFPRLLVVLAAIGGLLGALLRDARNIRSVRWLKHSWPNVVTAIALGVVFYFLTVFGAISKFSQILPVNVDAIPAVSGIGAFLLGLVGGLFGRRLFGLKAGPRVNNRSLFGRRVFERKSGPRVHNLAVQAGDARPATPPAPQPATSTGDIDSSPASARPSSVPLNRSTSKVPAKPGTIP